MDDLPRRAQLLQLLADGACHSGERLATQLQVTRAAVWKLVHALRDLGIVIESQHQGYQLAAPVHLYDAQRLQQALADTSVTVQCLFSVDSTNRHVHQQSIEPGRAVLCVAEIQQAGRGRRGRVWLAPFGGGICLSLGFSFAAIPPAISALSLVVGVALVRVLREHGADEVGVKWPNDLWWRGRKLAGVLIEMRGEPDGAAQLVVGLGLNLRLPEETRQALMAQHVAVCDLHEVLSARRDEQAHATITADVMDRNHWVAAFTRELLECVALFARRGFAPFHDEWQRYDVLQDAAVVVLNGEQRIDGVMAGVSADGSLLLDTPTGRQRFVSGEVSLRPT